MDYVTNDSSAAGNYFNTPNSSKSMEKTGERVWGGFSDGQGNTCKIVSWGKEYVIVGSSYLEYGNTNPVGSYQFYENTKTILKYCTGVVVLIG